MRTFFVLVAISSILIGSFGLRAEEVKEVKDDKAKDDKATEESAAVEPEDEKPGQA
ncbi:MAG: hypothetical protein JRJ19_03530, partial [Deltaproteobacteria bacterium]|nr:hypothetical protein [Deltaproteobacteria bacterium]